MDDPNNVRNRGFDSMPMQVCCNSGGIEEGGLFLSGGGFKYIYFKHSAEGPATLLPHYLAGHTLEWLYRSYFKWHSESFI